VHPSAKPPARSSHAVATTPSLGHSTRRRQPSRSSWLIDPPCADATRARAREAAPRPPRSVFRAIRSTPVASDRVRPNPAKRRLRSARHDRAARRPVPLALVPRAMDRPGTAYRFRATRPRGRRLRREPWGPARGELAHD